MMFAEHLVSDRCLGNCGAVVVDIIIIIIIITTEKTTTAMFEALHLLII